MQIFRRVSRSHALISMAAMCAAALLSACGGGESEDPGTVTPPIVGQTFAPPFNDTYLQGSDATSSYFVTGNVTFRVNDSAGNVTGIATINTYQFPLTGTVSPTDKSTRLSFSTATGSGTIIGEVRDQTGFYGFTGKFDITVPREDTGAPTRFTGNVYASTNVATAGGGGSGSGGSTGLTGTWCTDVQGNQNCWVFDNETGSSRGQFYQQSINQYAGTLTNTMTWSVDSAAKTMTYRFTRSTLTNSASNYDQAVNIGPYTFPFTLTATTFRFQGIDFSKQ